MSLPQATPRRPLRSALSKRRLLERLRLLCGCGAGLEAIAAPVCTIARDLVGAASGSIFWLDKSGAPAGFFHDSAPAELKDLFVTHFDELFSAPGQFNMVTLTQLVGPPIGRVLDDAMRDLFLQSNVYKYLSSPLGHEHCLDVRIEDGDRCVALLVLWNPKGRPFIHRDVIALRPTKDLLEQALRAQRPDVVWRSHGSRTAHFITDIHGIHLLAIDTEAETLLNRCHLLRQNVPMNGQPRETPAFARQLAAMLAQGVGARLRLPVADGRLSVSASSSRLISGDRQEALQMLVSVDIEAAVDVLAVERLSALPLTLLQKQIALFGAQGGFRGDCEQRFGVRQEALKKHLRMIYNATGVANWTGLRDQFWMALLT